VHECMKCEEVLGLQMPLHKLGKRTKAATGVFERMVENSVSERRNIYSLEYPGSFSASGRTKSKQSPNTQLENFDGVICRTV